MKRRKFLRNTTSALGMMAVGGEFGLDWRRIQLNGDRLRQRLEMLAEIGQTPDGGVSRLAFSDEDLAAREFCQGLMHDAGLLVRVDAVGNIIGRLPGHLDGARPIMFGSHIDTVPNGGKYDGSLGSLAAIEVLQSLAEDGYESRHPLEAVIWCDEESGLTGSVGFVGHLSQEELAEERTNGLTLAQCIEKLGGDPARVHEAAHRQGDIAAYLELHVEQGAVLDQAGISIGIVEGIVGIRHYEITLTGFPNHAGTTPMNRRQDALLAASAIVLAVNEQVRSVPGHHVGTVGEIDIAPNVPNVIPGRVTLTVELRDLSNETIDLVWEHIRSAATEIARDSDISIEITLTAQVDPALADQRIRDSIASAALGLGLTTHSMPSGAGHDAQELAKIAPIGMIFVPSVDGISHAPLEFTRPEDVLNGANVLLESILRLDRE